MISTILGMMTEGSTPGRDRGRGRAKEIDFLSLFFKKKKKRKNRKEGRLSKIQTNKEHAKQSLSENDGN